ncbi:MAG: hypothetical protein OEY49_17980, partial [Candidatus Heimdallarchaeota archaeon]|nr:hypothetical protein [Candidatus Heimdallarchaeota archaeon]
MSNQKELIFSIYPKINTTSNNNIFNIQTIHKSGYYPTELEYLVNKIHFANTNLEVEENTREYHDFINKRKLELLEMFKWIKKCENLNQRELFLLINNHHILHNEQNEIIYIGGPLGGGYLKLDHTLDEMENEHWYSFLSLDEKGIGKEIPSVNTEKEYNNAILDNSLGDLLNISNFPIIIDSLEFSIIPALRYFEKEYERISIINDFAPLVDSALTAARSIINQNYLYFQEIPSILKQRLVQYKINQDTHIPDFLGLQKLIIESSKQNNFKLKILGYSFNSGTKSFSLVVDELFSNYTILLIVEDEFTKSLKFVEEIKQELELKREIIAFENDFRNKSDLTKTNVKYSSNLVWFNSYKSLISKINKTQSKQTFQYPIGFIDIKIGDDGNVHYNHSFNENEFPIEYTSILDHFKNALELIVTGPLDLFNFKVDNISVHLADNCNRYVLTNYLAKKDENRTTFIISYEIQSIQELNLIFLKRNRDLTSDEQNIELLCKNEYNKIKINLAQIAEKPENIIPFIELNEIISNPKPLSLYSKKILSSNVVPVLLKRIIIEIEQWE